jgi:HAD superfamily hydrolase (TIGR01484 family)
MPAPIQVVCTDFDGTVFEEFEQQPISKRWIEQIGRLQAQGVKWVINTGRDLSSLMEALGRTHISVQPDYLVLVEREIYVHNGSSYQPLRYWNDTCRADHDLLFRQVRVELPALTHWIATNHLATIYADAFSPLCLIAESNEEANRIHAYLEEFTAGVPCLAVVRNDVYMRFCHTSYNKGSALAEIRESLGVPTHETFVAGDHFNDLPMLQRQRAIWLTAPSNAIEEVQLQVRQQGGFVSGLPAGDGVAEGLEWSLEEAAAGRRPMVGATP